MFEWGCYNEEVEGADMQWIGFGLQNTLDIINQGCETENGMETAAEASFNFEPSIHNDWYLPSKFELVEMYNSIGNGSSLGNIGGFETSDWPVYWSSSEHFYQEQGYDYSTTAWFVSFNGGGAAAMSKSSSRRVRVIRAF